MSDRIVRHRFGHVQQLRMALELAQDALDELATGVALLRRRALPDQKLSEIWQLPREQQRLVQRKGVDRQFPQPEFVAALRFGERRAPPRGEHDAAQTVVRQHGGDQSAAAGCARRRRDRAATHRSQGQRGWLGGRASTSTARGFPRTWRSRRSATRRASPRPCRRSSNPRRRRCSPARRRCRRFRSEPCKRPAARSDSRRAANRRARWRRMTCRRRPCRQTARRPCRCPRRRRCWPTS